MAQGKKGLNILGKKEEPVIVKKIKPYPFVVQFSKDGLLIQGQVIKLVLHGFMVELGSAVVKVGEQYQAQFTLPSESLMSVVAVKVIKTYDRYQSTEAPTKAMRLAEFHFLSSNEDLKKKIKHFLKAIKQVGTDLV